MGALAGVRRFLLSRAGSAFIRLVLVCAVLSAGMTYAFYRSSISSFIASKSEEKITALQLVDAFVTNYSSLRGALPADKAPVPATFRAHSIELFNQARGGDQVLRLRWVGRPGRFIRTPPADPPMAKAVEAFAGQANPRPYSEFVTIGGEPVFRTVYPSFASQQSCVDCHNQLQPQQHWQLNDLMGAFSIDVPAGPFLAGLYRQCIAIWVSIFLVMATVGLVISLLHYRQLAERETAQKRLAESEQRFRDFAEVASDWFWEQDEQLRISFVSENDVSRRLSVTRASQVGKTRWEIVKDGITEEQRREHQACLDARRPFQRFRYQRLDRNGEPRIVELNGKPVFDASGVFGGYRGTARDITAEVAVELELARRVEKRTEELRAAQEELLRRERLSWLGQLTATVAHELRNPLSAIRNTAFSIAEIAAGNGLKLDRPLARLGRSIQRCDGLITDLLEYARMRELKRVDLPLDTWLDEVLDEQKLPDGVRLTREFGAAGVVLSFDPERLRRVVINLVENACQALTEPGAAPQEQEATVTVGTRETGGVLLIRIEDNGPGITPEVLPKIFDPLFSTRSFGTGLGLPTVRQIVEQHGGRIEIDSQPGAGARVLITLPLSHALAELAA